MLKCFNLMLNNIKNPNPPYFSITFFIMPYINNIGALCPVSVDFSHSFLSVLATASPSLEQFKPHYSVR